MSQQDELPICELLGITGATLTNEDQSVMAPVVFLTVRPEPRKQWTSFTFPIGLQQAYRLRDDLAHLLKEIEEASSQGEAN